MSLESTIAGLVTASNKLTDAVNGKMGQIDLKVTAAVSAVPSQIISSMARSFLVDPVSGNDLNDGSSWEKAKKTIAGVVYSSPSGSINYIYLKPGVVHELTDDVDCANKVVYIIGNGFSYADPSTWSVIRSVPSVAPDGEMVAGGFRLGYKGFVALLGVRCETAKFEAAHVGKVNQVWRTSFLKTNDSYGDVMLQFCNVFINNAAMMYQHNSGSVGFANLIMRGVRINKVDLTGFPVPTGLQFMMGAYGNQPIPFSMYGVDMIRIGAQTWAELINQNMSNAVTNIKD